LRFNDGTPVPEETIRRTLLELEDKFEAVSFETQIIQGRGRQGERSFRDDLMRVFSEVEDKPENREFFREFKERLKQRFQQVEIYMRSFLVESE
jgi:hypothetical protein